MRKLIQGKDFYLTKDGLMVFTKSYLSNRGYCCKSGCLNCPYRENQKLDPDTPAELNDPWTSHTGEEPEVYLFEVPEEEEL